MLYSSKKNPPFLLEVWTIGCIGCRLGAEFKTKEKPMRPTNAQIEQLLADPEHGRPARQAVADLLSAIESGLAAQHEERAELAGHCRCPKCLDAERKGQAVLAALVRVL